MNQEQNNVENKSDTNREEWRLTIETEVATLNCLYDSATVIRRIVMNLRRILNPNETEAQAFEEAAKNFTQRILMNAVKSSLKDALERSEIEAQKRTIRELSDGGFPISRDKLSRWIEQGAREARSQSRRRMGARQRGGSEARYSLSHLRTNYEKLLPVWREAKRLYRQNATRRNWHAMVKAEYESLPDDLVDKLNLRGENKPSDLAIQHAARLCGVPPDGISNRQLWERLRSQRRS